MSDAELRPSTDLALLRSLAARCGGSSPPSPAELEDALEHGFAALMTLEARLQRAGADAGALAEEIEALRSALTDLRASSNSGLGDPLALGFVLPPKR